MTNLEQAILELIKRTSYGSITIHIQNNKIIWVDKDRRYSSDGLINEMLTMDLRLDKIELDQKGHLRDDKSLGDGKTETSIQ